MTTNEDIGSECSHEFERWASRGGGFGLIPEEEAPPMTVILRCNKCSEKEERPATEKEEADNRESNRLSAQLHKPFHEIVKATEDLSSCEAMDKFAEFKEKYPEHVHIARIDDDHHCGSDLVFIEHRSEAYYWGTSVVVIPQCTGEAPLRFFMYPGHMQNVLEAFAAIQRHGTPSKFEFLCPDMYECEDDPDPLVVVRLSQVKTDGDAEAEIKRLRSELKRNAKPGAVIPGVTVCRNTSCEYVNTHGQWCNLCVPKGADDG